MIRYFYADFNSGYSIVAVRDGVKGDYCEGSEILPEQNQSLVKIFKAAEHHFASNPRCDLIILDLLQEDPGKNPVFTFTNPMG